MLNYNTLHREYPGMDIHELEETYATIEEFSYDLNTFMFNLTDLPPGMVSSNYMSFLTKLSGTLNSVLYLLEELDPELDQAEEEDLEDEEDSPLKGTDKQDDTTTERID